MKKKLSKANIHGKSYHVKESEVSYFTPIRKSTPKEVITKDFLYADFKHNVNKAPPTGSPLNSSSVNYASIFFRKLASKASRNDSVLT